MENKNKNTELVINGVDFKNFEDAKKLVQDTINNCNFEEVTIDNLQPAKKTRAILNKMSKSIDSQRIAIKNKTLELYNNICEPRCKELKSYIQAGADLVDEGVKKIEEEFRLSRKKYIYQLCQEYGVSVDLRVFVESTWLNQSTSDNKVEKFIKAKSEVIKKDLTEIENMEHEFGFEMVKHYKLYLSLSSAMEEGRRLLNNKKEKEKLAAKRLAEKKEIEEEMKAIGDIQEDETISEDGEVKKIRYRRYEVSGIDDDFNKVEKFFISNGINFEVK